MKASLAHLDYCRVKAGKYGSTPGARYGAFTIFDKPQPNAKHYILCIAYDGTSIPGVPSEYTGWEHVSVSMQSRLGKESRTPSWDEMCFAKDLFWDPEEAVIQFHPPTAQYVNNHPHVLHLWRPVGQNLSLPPMILV